jgi:hypothetical protein
MTTEAQNVKFRRQMDKLEASRRTPDKVKMLPRDQDFSVGESVFQERHHDEP